MAEIVEAQKSTESLRALEKSPSSSDYNTVFERILARTEGDDGINLVVACVAYFLYKQQKRDWIIQHSDRKGQRPQSADIDLYVSGWTDMRINSELAQATQMLQMFADSVTEHSMADMDDQIYKNQFQSLHEAVSNQKEDYANTVQGFKDHVTKASKPRWGTAIGQGLLISLIWTIVVVVVVLGVNLGFDFSDLPSRVHAFEHPQLPKQADEVAPGQR